MVAHPPAFPAHHIEGVRPAPRVLLDRPEVARPLPAPHVLPLGAEGVEVVVDRGGAQGPAGRPVFAGHPHLVHLLVLVDPLIDRVVQVRPRAEAPGIHLRHVDLRLAVDHPLGQESARSGPLADADGGSDTHPVVAQARGRAHEVARVGGVGDRATDHLLDPGSGEYWEPLGRVLQPGLKGFQVGRGEVEVEVPVDAVDPVEGGVGPLVGTDQ